MKITFGAHIHTTSLANLKLFLWKSRTLMRFYSFTFDIKSRDDINFFRELAEILISISAGNENECFDAEDSANFIDDAYQYYEDWTKGLVQTDPIVLNHYQRLLTEWPLDEEAKTD